MNAAAPAAPVPDPAAGPVPHAAVVPPPPGLWEGPLQLPHGICLRGRGTGPLRAGRPKVLLLHGFPEAAFIWDGVLQALAPVADALAPDQRGYAGSDRPADVADYRPRHLVADALALIDQLAGPGQPIDLLVAHDWGGGIAWNLAALAPQRVRHLVILNAPHAGAMLRELLHSADQRAASQYMNQLVRPDAAQQLAADDFAALWALFTRFGAAPWLTPERRAQYRAVWSRGLDGALNWYRASPLRPPTGDDDAHGWAALRALQLPDSVVRVPVPTTVLWGEADTALRPGLLDGLSAWVPQLSVHRRPGASHWLVHEEPDWVIEHLRALLPAA